MSYEIIIPKTVQRQINKLPINERNTILKSLVNLQENTRPTNSLKMKNSSGYRLRVGEYRVLYDINDQAQLITLRRIGHRRDIYREK
jgi:mRNA interferase RelE/StbE